MNRSGSYSNHENRQIIITPFLIRRGAPFGAAAFVIFGGMGVSTPINNCLRDQFSEENLFEEI
jgi:hypothetical protein